ncbi:MAG TPA: glycosyltransferase [Thermomicrobiaceae bacterium]|nr:glycosyltransferase [Thermomicrobiaceae bacterium]
MTATAATPTDTRLPIPPDPRPLALPPLAERPLVSVLIASYNYADYVGQAIQSVLGQSYDHLEVVVCDDASRDDSCAVVEQYAAGDARVRLVRHERNAGMAAATNTAFAASRGQIVSLLDADDIYRPGKLAAIVREFQRHPEVGFILHRGMCVDAQGREIQEIPFLTGFECGWIADRLVRRGGRWRDMPTSALSFRREPAEYVFPIPEPEFRRASDGFIFTLLPLLTEVSAVDEVLHEYRVHGRNDFGAAQWTVDSVRADLGFIAGQVAEVNRRLAVLGVRGRSLDLARNLLYRQQSLVLDLLTGRPRRALLGDYVALVPRMVRDDLYGRLQKALGLVVYGLAIPLPVGARSRWLNAALGYNQVKQHVRRVLDRGRAVVR